MDKIHYGPWSEDDELDPFSNWIKETFKLFS